MSTLYNSDYYPPGVDERHEHFDLGAPDTDDAAEDFETPPVLYDDTFERSVEDTREADRMRTARLLREILAENPHLTHDEGISAVEWLGREYSTECIENGAMLTLAEN